MSKMDSTTGLNAGMALDERSLDALRLQATKDPQGSTRQVARQFEAQFAQMLLSQMRQTSLAGQGGLASALNSPAAKTWRGMLDQQLSQTLAGVQGAPGANGTSAIVKDKSGLGLADVIEQQLNRSVITAASIRGEGLPASMSTLELARRSMPASPDAMPAVPGDNVGFHRGPVGAYGSAYSTPFSPVYGPELRRIQNGKPASGANGASAATPQATRTDGASGQPTVAGSPEQVRAEFLGKFLPSARRAEAATGIPAEYILGQAALESGWGKHEIRGKDGQASHNLFGIKADGWTGRTSETHTTEYRGAQPQRVSAKFRAYDSYDEAFEDYARLLASNPRYTSVLKASGSAEQFAQGLQRVGYATDPRYAEKLASTIRRAMKVVV